MTVKDKRNNPSGMTIYDDLAYAVIVCTVFVLPLLVNSSLRNAYELPKYTFLSTACLLLGFLWTSRLIFSCGIVHYPNPVNLFMLLFVTAAFSSTLLSIRPATSLWGNYTRVVGFFTIASFCLFWYALSNIKLDHKRLLLLLSSLAASATVAATIGVLKYAGFSLGTRMFNFEGGSLTIASTLGNPNFLGAFLVLTSMITLGIGLSLFSSMSMNGWSKKTAYLFLFSFPVQLACIYFTFSRGAWLGMSVALVFFIIISSKQIVDRFRLIVIVTGLIILIIFIILLVVLGNALHVQKHHTAYDPVNRLTSAFDLKAGTAFERLTFWSVSLSMTRQHPLTGIGLDTFDLAFGAYRPKTFDRLLPRGKYKIPDRPHNDLLQISSSMGIIGLLFYLALIVAVFLAGFFALRKNHATTDYFIVSGLLAGLSGYIVQNLFNFHTVATGFIYWTALGMVSIAIRDPIPKVYRFALLSNISDQARRLIVFTLAIVFIFGLYKISLSPLLANWKANIAVALTGQKHFEQAEMEAKTAFHLMPSYDNYLMLLGGIYREQFRAEGDPYYHLLAIESFKKAIELNPLNKHNRLTLGIYYLKHYERYQDKDALKSAISVFKDLIKLEPNYGQSHYNLGVAYFYSQRYAEALDEFDMTLKLDPEESDAHLLIGKIHEAQGNKRSAIEHYRKALYINPGNTNAIDSLSALEDKR